MEHKKTPIDRRSQKLKRLLCVVIAEVLLVLLLILSLLFYKESKNSDLKDWQERENVTVLEDGTIQVQTGVTDIGKMTAASNITIQLTPEQLVREYMSTMTLEEKVGQLFFVTIGDLETPDYSQTTNYLTLSEAARENLQLYQPGGVIFMGGNIESDEQVKQLIGDLQGDSKTALFIGVDEEGGTVSRLGSNDNISMRNVGSMRAIGDTNDTSQAYDIGVELASNLLSYGFNLDFAPDADVLTNANNTEIGTRSFGSDASLVAGMVKSEVTGLEENGVSAVAKHFPGHGGVVGNSHQNLQYVTYSREELNSTELLPFESAIEADCDAILISHLVLQVPDEGDILNANETPSTLNKDVVTGILREQLGYQGVVITDSFQMGSITENYEQGQAAVMAINAGCDMILMPTSYTECYQAVIDAVNNGTLTEQQIDDACYRILYAKQKRGILLLE